MIAILLTLSKSKLTVLVHFNGLWAGHSCFIEFGQNARPWKTIQTLSFWQKIQEPGIGSGTSHFQWFNQQASRTWFPVNKLTLKFQLLISFRITHFFWFVQQNKICMIRIKTRKVLKLDYYFLTILRRAIFRT